MQIVPAANNLNIEFGPDTWRLVNTELSTPTTLLEATPEGMVTHPVFRAARSLPGATVAPAQIMRVMLGWAPESQAWRLGMLLVDVPASTFDTTQMQWCELAAWPDAIFTHQIDEVRLSGQALARLINRPFQFVERPGESRVPIFSPSAASPPATSATDIDNGTEIPDNPETEEEPVLPEIELLNPPIRFSDWRFTRISSGLRWQRVRTWWAINIGRLTLFVVLGVLFFVLSIGSQTRGLAQVEPADLPDIGLLIGGVMILSLLHTLWQLLSATAVVIDQFQREVYGQGLIFRFIHWRVPFDHIEYVLISQSPPNAQGRRRREDPMRIAQDVWIHVYDGTEFHEVVNLGNVEGLSWTWDLVRTHGHAHVRRRLQLVQYDTPAHHAAQQIANLIDVPVYLDLV